jgi:hypothetical protein
MTFTEYFKDATPGPWVSKDWFVFAENGGRDLDRDRICFTASNAIGRTKRRLLETELLALGDLLPRALDMIHQSECHGREDILSEACRRLGMADCSPDTPKEKSNAK